MGVHVCPARCSLVVRLPLLVLLNAVLLPPGAARTLRQRSDLSRRASTVHTRTSSAPTADVSEGSEIILVLKPPKNADERPSKEAVEDLKFAVANEAMRPMPLQRFLSKHGMNPKARLPPLHTITPGSGAAVAMGKTSVDMTAPQAPAAAPEQKPAVMVPKMWFPKGYDTTAPPMVAASQPGDLRQALTTEPPPIPVVKVPLFIGCEDYDRARNAGRLTFDQCKEKAEQQGSDFFGLNFPNEAEKDSCQTQMIPPSRGLSERWGPFCSNVLDSSGRSIGDGRYMAWYKLVDADSAEALAPAPAPGPAVASTTPMMMIRDDAYEVGSVRELKNMVRTENGEMLECSQCKCVKRVNGGIENVPDPTCE